MTTVCISVAGVVTETNGWGALAGVNLAKWIIFTLGHLLCCDHQHQLSFINIISHLWPSWDQVAVSRLASPPPLLKLTSDQPQVAASLVTRITGCWAGGQDSSSILTSVDTLNKLFSPVIGLLKIHHRLLILQIAL